MNLDIETSIRYPDGEEAGRITAVVLGNEGRAVEQVVMDTGGLLGREVLVPVNLLSMAPGDVLQINATPDEVDTLPDYRSAELAGPPEMALTGDALGMGVGIFPFNEMAPMLPVVEFENVDEASLVISQGTGVMCSDGRVGVVDEVVMDENGALAALIVRPDDEGAPDLRVPGTLIRRASAETVHLNCTVAQLPDYAEALLEEDEEPEPRSLF